MTRTTNDPGGTAFPDGERLHEAFAVEIDRPGLDGPSYDAVLRSGNARLRRRRVTVGATFALASVTAVATAVIATGGGASQNVNTADSPTNTTPAAAGTTTTPSASTPDASTPGASSSAATSTTAPTSPSHLPDAVIASGTLDGHAWQLIREYTPDPGPPPGITSMPGAPAHPKLQWCTSLNVIVDRVWTDAGAGGGGCVPPGQQVGAPSLTNPGFTSIAIVTPQHVRLGAVVTGSISPLTASVTAQCGAKSFTGKPIQPSGDNVAYYAFTLPNGSGCQTGALSFFDSSGSRVGAMSGVAFEGGK
ncbi:hypothetical protein [Catenulispora rubra]|uniref:hypothetical protein n=1 Tax=Catenulispora rubra TaxID=280293 RepID=UPI0018927E46|nr:hypothetical protein [Catenulispora rubra]